MSLVLIGRALEKRLGLLAPALDIAAENGTYQPKTGVPYQALALLTADTQTLDLAQQNDLERGVFQVMVCYPSSTGPVQARERAQLIREHFKPGFLPAESGLKVEIIGKPSVGPAMPQGVWFCIPVRIKYKAVIQS